VSGNFSQIDWSSGSYYLAIELDTGSGYVSMGTTQLLSVPYALYADTAGNVEALQTQINELVLLTDADNDGYSENQGDCDDTNATVYPGATEDETDGIDNDCDGEVDEALGYEATFYHFHMGASVAPYGDLMSTTATWYDSNGSVVPNSVSGFNTIMTDMIDEGDGALQSSGVTMPDTGTFEFAGPIDGQQGYNPYWTHNAASGGAWYYLAVPDNSSFNVNLVTAQALQLNGSGTYNASERRAFVYNGENYWLYKMANASGTTALQFGFK
jgi:hypothetical protein